jgi:hypothetical protein
MSSKKVIRGFYFPMYIPGLGTVTHREYLEACGAWAPDTEPLPSAIPPAQEEIVDAIAFSTTFTHEILCAASEAGDSALISMVRMGAALIDATQPVFVKSQIASRRALSDRLLAKKSTAAIF